MKKQAMIIGLLSAGLIGQSVHADPSIVVIEWTGTVPGVFNGTEIGLTGAGGGEIQAGTLNIQNDGSFTSLTPIVVEAHEMITDAGGDMVPGPQLYNGKVDWELVGTSVTHAAYAEADIAILMNGIELVKGTAVSTEINKHVVAFTATSDTPTGSGSVNAGQTIAVQALIMAQEGI